MIQRIEMNCIVEDDSSMTYDVAHLSHDLVDDGPAVQKASLSRAESIDSISGEANYDYNSSDELDKLSSCLSEVSNDSGSETSSSIFYDIVQAQVGLWTCVFSLLYSYAWGQHRKKFLLSIFFVIPTVFTVCCAISALLTTIVIIGRVFSTPIAYKQFLNLEDRLAECTEDIDFVSLTRRHRLNSGASDISITSDDCLPKPLCRRHSGSHTSLCHSRPPSVNRKMSYVYSHQSAVSDDETP